jgi:hypothetical protein
MLKLTITSPYFIVDFNVQLFTPTTVQSERGGVGKASPIGWAHFCLSAKSKTGFFMPNVKRGSTRNGDEEVRADFMSCNRHIIEHGLGIVGNPMLS